MLVGMSRSEFEAHSDASLVWACIEPTVREIRGRSLAVKMEASHSLTEGQRALLMFQVIYGHAQNGIEAMFVQLSYLFSKNGLWNEFMRSAQFFGDEQFLVILRDIAALFPLWEESTSSTGKAEDSIDIKEAMGKLNSDLDKTLPATLKRVASYIRSNPTQFIQFAG
jgi:hypothetical protein